MASSKALEVVSRGIDSSGRPLQGTRQAFQHFDRVNAKVKGKLVIIQGAFRGSAGAEASAGTHSRAGCFDIRTWNLSASERYTMLREARDLGAAAWYRTTAQGFDPHSHWVLIGDEPMDPLAAAQIDMYRKGYNGLGSYSYRDDFPYRPARIVPYVYQEDEIMADQADRIINFLGGMEDRIVDRVNTRTAGAEKRTRERDVRMTRAERERDGRLVDLLTLVQSEVKDDATKRQVRKARADILEGLKIDSDKSGVTDADTPSEDAVSEADPDNQ